MAELVFGQTAQVFWVELALALLFPILAASPPQHGIFDTMV